MINLRISKIAEVLHGRFQGEDVEILGAHNDTRALQAGNLFIAIPGINLDGHDYVAQAKAAGAVAALVSKVVDVDLPQIIVKDTTQAMGDLARYWREQFTLPVVGITGSVGKTTTRQMVGAILSERGLTLVSAGNNNNFYGVPLTLFRLGAEHKYAVIEMGADRPGEITYLTNIVQPQVAVITMVAPVHLEVKKGVGFGSIEGVLHEKTQIFSRLSENGVAILNADSPFIDYWQKELAKHRRLTFGMTHKADVTASNLLATDDLRYKFVLRTPMGTTDIHLSSLGKHNVNNAVCASAAALAAGATLEDIKRGLANVPVVARRMIKKPGLNGSIIIDDSYNANLVATKAVLDLLHDCRGKKHIMVFGDMRELGAMSKQLHQEVGEYAKKLAIDYFFAYGPESEAAVIAYDAPNAQHFKSHDALVAKLKPLLDKNTMVVVKGSHGMDMDKIVEQIIEEN